MALIACTDLADPHTMALDVGAHEAAYSGGRVGAREPARRPVSTDRKTQIIASYRAGVKVTDLALQFCIHRSTVRNILREAGVAPRGTYLDGRIIEVRTDYESGKSIAATAAHFGVSRGAILRLMKHSKIPRRGTHDWHWAELTQTKTERP